MPKATRSQHAAAVQTAKAKTARGVRVDSLDVGSHGAAGVEVIKKRLMADRTTEKYEGQMGRLSKWLVAVHENAVARFGALDDFDESAAQALDWSSPDTLTEQARTNAFRTSLEKPNWLTPRVIGAYLMKKALTDATRHQTADQVQSALIKYFNRLGDGETYRGDWKKVNGQWQGNPARAGSVVDLKKSLKHEEQSRGEARNHSLPMTKEYLRWLHQWTYETAPEGVTTGGTHRENVEILQHSGFRLFSSLAWTLWARCFEVLRLRWGDIEFDVDHPDHPGLQYDAIHMLDRKGFELRNVNSSFHDNVTLRGQTFNVYSTKDGERFLDLRFLLRSWRRHYEAVIKRPVQRDDYLFPYFGNGGLTPTMPASSDWPEKMLSNFVAATPALQKKNGCFTTHCFRRGGAQYRFMFAPPEERWALTVCQRWGGWAEGEGAYTIVKYLIDELYQEEHSVADMLCPIKANTDGQLSARTLLSNEQMFDGLTRLFADWKVEMKATVSEGFLNTQGSIRDHIVSLIDTRNNVHASSPTSSTARTPAAPSTVMSPPPMHPAPGANGSPQPAAPSDRSQFPSSAHLHLTVPKVSFGPIETQWEKVICDWNSADPARNLHTPLKDWPSTMASWRSERDSPEGRNF